MINRQAIQEQLEPKWGSKLQYIECDQGWYPIIAELDEQITKIAPSYSVQQVKEKFGGLRYYIGALHADVYDQVHALISEAERKAAETCECCGEPGRLSRRRGWVKTLCKSCFVDWVEFESEPSTWDINAEKGE